MISSFYITLVYISIVWTHPLSMRGCARVLRNHVAEGGLSIEGEHCFSLMMYVFCSKNSLYSANFLFIMFNFLLNSSVNLVLLIKPACYELYTFLDPVFCNPEDVLNTIWKLYSFNERNLSSFQVLCSHWKMQQCFKNSLEIFRYQMIGIPFNLITINSHLHQVSIHAKKIKFVKIDTKKGQLQQKIVIGF